MPNKGHNAKKPKLAGHAGAHTSDQIPVLQDGAEGTTPKHKMSFAQHQHEQQMDRAATPMPPQEAPAQHLKGDAQQHQQKAGSHR